MAGTKHWVEGDVVDGVCEITLSSWKWFGDFINKEMLDYREYVYRGHASENWALESTLDRTLKRVPTDRREAARKAHLQNFRLAARGRRGSSPRQIDLDDDWWALGQHHGLATPLLDWTESPFVALYFAFSSADTQGAEYRAIWAISDDAVTKIAASGIAGFSDVRSVKPLSDENPRLVNQRGLFVRCPEGSTLEAAVRQSYAGESSVMELIKLRVPNRYRTDCLRFLNRMNINHLSLFPDLSGASTHANNEIVIQNY